MSKQRKFKLSINPGAIGVKASQLELLEMAKQHGFEAIVAMPEELAGMKAGQIEALQEEMAARKISWGSASLPVEFRKSEMLFRQGINQLPRLAEAVRKAGGTRMNTWIMPTHQELTYRDNFAQHASRLQTVAKILNHQGIRLGLEYVGPKTLMTRYRYAFIRTMKEVMELITKINVPNVAIQLDSFHWFCAGETEADLLSLDKEQIVTVDLNDAKAGRTADEQIDNERELPGMSGVVDIKTFLKALLTIGYDGPVRAEPFNKKLNQMDDQSALKATASAMKKVLDT